MKAKDDHFHSKSKGLVIEWPLLLTTVIPAVLLCLLCAGLWINHHAQTLRHQQAQHLSMNLLKQFSDPASWASAQELQLGLKPFNWQQAYLRDHQGARSWHQSRPGSKPDVWPRAEEVSVPISSTMDLVFTPGPLPAAQAANLRRLALFLGMLGLVAGISSGLLCYGLAAGRLQRTLNWARQLEKGSLNASPPVQDGLSGGIANSLEIIAQRLRFSRDALKQHTDHAARRNEERLRQLQQDYEQLEGNYQRTRQQLNNRSEFTSSMSHELRTPLTAITGFAELLEKGELTAEQMDYAQTIRKSAKGLINMISDLLDMERIEAGRLEIHSVSFDPSNAVEDTLSLIAPLAYEKNLELISIVDHDTPPLLQGDAARVQQILTNLVSNAIKFTPQGQVLVRVSRRADQDNAVRLRFEVEDSGIGISPEQQKQLFTAFQRFENPFQNRGNGSGLGLSIVKRLTDLLDGEIEVTSTPSSGSTFAVTLPFQQPQQRDHKASWDALRGVDIWVLEPHDIRWHALEHLLAFWQMNSRRFKSAGELLRVLQSVKSNKRPDLMILGLRADEAGDQSVLDIMGMHFEPPLPSACLVNSVDSNLHRKLKKAGAWAVLPRCSERSSLYRSFCELLNHDLAQDSAPQPLLGQSILVAENNTASRHFLKVLLSTLGADPILVEDGLAAVNQWQKNPTRFVLLDMNMPRMNGLEATRVIREHAGSSDTVIIGMSAFLSAEEEQNWIAAGLDASLPKPFDEAQLLRCLHPWLRREKPSSDNVQKPKLARQLLEDPTLYAMIMEELPKQLQDLDEAFISGELERTRAAAHHLHGTAAFFHLEPLKNRAHILEKRLKEIRSIEGQSWLRDDMASISEAVRQLLASLRNRELADELSPPAKSA